MSRYDLDRMGSKDFEHLVQALLKKVIGSGTITFGEGPDGGREATFSGGAPYPSPSDQWKGEWIFQATFHDVHQIGPDKARRQVLADLKTELETITVKYKRKCNNYILATNVPLTATHARGTHDKIAKEIVPEYCDKIPNIHIWGYDDMARFLDGQVDVRQAYLHLLTPGDLIAELMDRRAHKYSELAETVLLYVRSCFEAEQYAQLDQAGELGERPIPLRRVFVDLDLKCRSEKDALSLLNLPHLATEQVRRLASKEKSSAVSTLLLNDLPKTVLIGGPGQGKSTLGQFIAHIHRAHLTCLDFLSQS